ncbi:hypothetical protein [Bacteroides uniformis]|jgi:hypothetical protein BACCOPRO_01459|uniref:hypothetical protein n=2 Tax=Bacteroidaceae TaxID=815 RepID=UPI00321B7A34
MSSNKDIFNSAVLPVMKKVQHDLEEAKRQEMIKHQSSWHANMLGGIGPDGGMTAIASHNNLIYTIGEWNSKTADDYLKTVNKILLSKGIKVTPEIEQQMIDYLVKQKMPKSTTDYIIKKIQEGNVFSATLSATRTSLEGHIKQEAEKEYNPSSLEKLAGEVSAFVSNAVVTMGQGTIASFIGQTLLSTTANSMDHSQAQQEQYLEEKKKQAKKEIAAANKKEVSIPSWMMKQMGISNISEASNEELMKAHEWAYQNALSYRNKIHATVSEGKRAVKASGKSNYISLTEATLQAKRYESFQRLLEDEITNRMNHPQWMMEKMGFKDISQATEKQLHMATQWASGNAKMYRDKIQKAALNGQSTVKASGKDSQMSIDEATARALQYEAFAKAAKAEANNRKVVSPVAYDHIDEAESDEAYRTSNSTNDANTANSTNNENQQSNTPSGDYSGWNNMISEVGLKGSVDTMKNLGLSLANLPDMLIRLFTGQTKNEGLTSGTILPFALIMCGIFSKNPMLKIPLLLLGATNLLNKSTEHVLEKNGLQKEENSSVNYKQYADEPLNQRLKNPQLEGNVLLVDIDNVPRIVTLPPTVVDAYHKGALPLNTLANRILNRADQLAVSESQSLQASEKYESNQVREQSKGLR